MHTTPPCCYSTEPVTLWVAYILIITLNEHSVRDLSLSVKCNIWHSHLGSFHQGVTLVVLPKVLEWTAFLGQLWRCVTHECICNALLVMDFSEYSVKVDHNWILLIRYCHYEQYTRFIWIGHLSGCVIPCLGNHSCSQTSTTKVNL